MRSIRFYKVLMPAVLIVFAVLLVMQLKPVEGVHSAVAGATGLQVGTSVDGVTAVDFDGDRKHMEIDAGSIQRDENDRMKLERINALKLYRDGQLPLLLQALRGDIEGERGARTMNFADGVVLEDPEKGVRVRVPDLVLEEATQEARSTGKIVLDGEFMSGTAEGLIYRFDGRPAELDSPTFRDDAGATLKAARATLFDGPDDVELEGNVRARRGEEYLDAERLRVKRVDDLPSHATASGNVRGAALVPGNKKLAEFSGANFDIRFDPMGDPRLIAIEGEARLAQGSQSFAADTILMRRLTDEGDWRVSGRRGVVIEGESPEGPGLLRAERVDAVLDRNGDLADATATGGVSFDAVATRAEARRATFTSGIIGELRLFGTQRRKARLARLQMRVAAEEIAITANRRLFAEREVEATLLGDAARDAETAGPFKMSEPIHFVSETLLGEDGGSTLVFEGQVRGWQGDRNLSADRITLDQKAQSLLAEDNVTARMPRAAGISASQADFVQISATRLEYAADTSIGVFRNGVRVTLAEGWLDADTVEFETDTDGGGVREIRAAGNIRLEFRQVPEDGGPPEIVTGTGDRMVYDPVEETVRLIGEQAPATVRRIGEGRGTTAGRVLRYRLKTGTLEVESGSIQTGN